MPSRRLLSSSLLITTFVCLLLAATPPRRAAAAAPGVLAPAAAAPGVLTRAALLRLRIGVVAYGIYRLTPADLQQAGVDPAAIDPRSFVMSSQGQLIAIRVVGEADGRFDASDAIEFFGEKFRGDEQDEKYTDERVYWLDGGGSVVGAPSAARIADVDATPTGALTPPGDYPAVLRAEENNQWYTLYRLDPPSKDTWFWDQLRPVSTDGTTRNFPGTVPYPASGAPATLWIDQNARAAANHRTELSLNGVKLGEAAWWGVDRSFASFTVPSGLLNHGVNTVSDHAVLVPPAQADWIYFNYWELHYRRLFRAWQGRLDFRAETPGRHEYLIDGWDTTPVAVWDISTPGQPRRLTGTTVAAATQGQALRFGVVDTPGSRYWLQTEATLGHPASLRQPSQETQTGLRNPDSGYDVVIITSTELRPAAERLARFDRQRGYRVLVADFADVVDEFNDGIYHPRAVPTMLAWAQMHWPDPKPRYLTLFGDGHWNFKGYNPSLYPPQPQHIPPYLAWIDPTQGEVPADAWYGDLNGDRLPELAVGRIAVNTLDEADAVLAKIESYDENALPNNASAPSYLTSPWQQNAIFVADNEDDAGDFPGLSDTIIDDYLPPWFTATRIYLNRTVPNAAAARTAIRSAIDEGAILLQYAGHGNPPRWANELIWTLADVSSLQNGGRLPVVMTFNCLDGYFAHPQPQLFSLAETMQRQPNGGSVAAISPSSLGFTAEQHEYRQLLMQAIFRDGIHTLGDALLKTQRDYYARMGPHYLIDTMMLYGDPTLHLPLAEQRLYLPWEQR